MQFIGLFKPKALYLHHFDDSYPPVSAKIDTTAFLEKIRAEYPEMKVIIPQFGQAGPV